MIEPSPSDIWIVIPAYNEDGAIVQVLKGLAVYGYSVVVVDDGSQTSIQELVGGLLEDCHVHVCRHVVNLGQGAALQTGIEFALRCGGKYLVTFDADGQHQASEISRMLEPLLSQDCEIVLGSRFMKDGRVENIPLKKYITLKLAVMFTRVTTGLSLTDTHNGFRAMTAEAARKLGITQNRMSHASQILRTIAERKMRYAEVPVTIKYTEYSMRKGQRISNALNILWESFAERIQ
jgi:glycosyltransferase involved in cell wall biosynthesis